GRVVLGVALAGGASLAVAPQQRRCGGVPQTSPDEERRASCRRRVPILGDAARTGKRRNHQAVPRRQYLVVQMRTRARRAPLEQLLACASERSVDLLPGFRGRRHHLVDAARGVEEVLVDELVL